MNILTSALSVVNSVDSRQYEQMNNIDVLTNVIPKDAKDRKLIIIGFVRLCLLTLWFILFKISPDNIYSPLIFSSSYFIVEYIIC